MIRRATRCAIFPYTTFCRYLVLFGLVTVFSASAVMAQSTLGSPYSYVGRQAGWALLGLVAMVLLMRVDYRRYNNRSEEHTSELQSPDQLVCRLLLEKKKTQI